MRVVVWHLQVQACAKIPLDKLQLMFLKTTLCKGRGWNLGVQCRENVVFSQKKTLFKNY